MRIFEISSEIAESGLVVQENHERSELYVSRPASLKGTQFRGWKEDSVIGMGDTLLKMNAPTAMISIKGRGRKQRFHLNISIPAAPGPGPEWINETFKSSEEVIAATLDCYFAQRIDMKNQSLESWFNNET